MKAVTAKTAMAQSLTIIPLIGSWVTEGKGSEKYFCSAPHFQPASPMSSISAPRVMTISPRRLGCLAGRKKELDEYPQEDGKNHGDDKGQPEGY